MQKNYQGDNVMSNENPLNYALMEVAKSRSKEIYDDALKPISKETGELLGAIVGLFNNVVLYPVKKANISFRYKLEEFEKDLNKKINSIPSENLIEPPLNVSGPILEGLKYTFDTKELREMFIELLSAAMNRESIEGAHPSYVEVIKSMSKIDAMTIRMFRNTRNFPASNIQFRIDESKYFTEAMPKIFVPDFLHIAELKLIGISIDNLCRLGLIEFRSTDFILNYDYETFKNHEIVKERLRVYNERNADKEIYITVSQSLITLTEFGKNFVELCVPD